MTEGFNIAASAIPQEDADAFVAAAVNGDGDAILQAIGKFSRRIVNARDSNGEIALAQAAKKGHYKAVSLLLENGADPNGADSEGTTALMWTVWDGHTAIAALLLQKGASVDLANDIGITALIWAAMHGRYEIAALLLEKGADIDARHNKGSTARMLAEKYGHPDILPLIHGHELERDITVVHTGIKEEIDVRPIVLKKKGPAAP